MNGSQLLKKSLQDANINFIFGYIGGAIMPFYDEADKGNNKLRIIQTRNEQGAAYMAQGVSRATYSSKERQIGACLTTSGPGATNLVTSVADAYMDSIGIISISGQVPTGAIGTDAFQETDVVGVMLPITKQVYMPLTPSEMEKIVHEAKYIASTGRPGPVHIDLPKDIQINEVTSDYKFDYKTYKPNLLGYTVADKPNNKSLQDAIKLIKKSKRPVIFNGHGVRISNAGKELMQFAKMINAPVASTLHGISAFPFNHPLHLGMMGMHGTVEANRTIQNADLIISFGMRFDDRVTGKISEYAKNADVIHVEIDPSEIDKVIKTTVGINADVTLTLQKFLKEIDMQTPRREEWFELIDGYKKEQGDWHDKELKKGVGQEGRLLMKTVIAKLSEVTNGEDILVSDVGQHQMICARYYNYQTTNSAFTSGGAGTMGVALPMSIGVKLARQDETVWSVCGDGSFQMNMQELGTIMQYDIDVKIIILNNRYLGMVKQWQTLFYKECYAGTPMQTPNFGKISEGYNIPYLKVSKVADIEKAIKQAQNHKGAYILEFECDSTELILPMVATGKTFAEMIVNPEDAQSKC